MTLERFREFYFDPSTETFTCIRNRKHDVSHFGGLGHPLKNFCYKFAFCNTCCAVKNLFTQFETIGQWPPNGDSMVGMQRFSYDAANKKVYETVCS